MSALDDLVGPDREPTTKAGRRLLAKAESNGWYQGSVDYDYARRTINAIELETFAATPPDAPCNHEWQPWLANTSQCSCCGARRDDLAPTPPDALRAAAQEVIRQADDGYGIGPFALDDLRAALTPPDAPERNEYNDPIAFSAKSWEAKYHTEIELRALDNERAKGLQRQLDKVDEVLGYNEYEGWGEDGGRIARLKSLISASIAPVTRHDKASGMPGGEDATAHEWDTGHPWRGSETICYDCEYAAAKAWKAKYETEKALRLSDSAALHEVFVEWVDSERSYVDYIRLPLVERDPPDFRPFERWKKAQSVAYDFRAGLLVDE